MQNIGGEQGFLKSAMETLSMHIQVNDECSEGVDSQNANTKILMEVLAEFGKGKLDLGKFSEQFCKRFSKLNRSVQGELISELAQLKIGSSETESQKPSSVHRLFQSMFVASTEGINLATDLTRPEIIPVVCSEVSQVIKQAEIVREYRDVMAKDVMNSIFEDKLYLGTSNASRDKNFQNLRKHGVNHILIILPLGMNFRRQSALEEEGFKVSVLNIPDLGEKTADSGEVEILKKSLPGAFAFLDRGVTGDNGVVIHCNKAIHRSPSILLAYLMKRFDLSYEEAEAFLKAKRSSVNIPHMFKAFLLSEEFEKFMKTL